MKKRNKRYTPKYIATNPISTFFGGLSGDHAEHLAVVNITNHGAMAAIVQGNGTKICKKCSALMLGKKCRPCENKAAAIYRENNREKMRAASKKWQLENPEKYSQSLANYRAKNKGIINFKRRIYRAANREKINPLKRAWHARHKESINSKRRSLYAANPEKYRIWLRAWKEKNREKVDFWNRRWRANNPEKVRAIAIGWYQRNKEHARLINQNRRARLSKAGGKLTKGLSQILFRKQNGKCACCGLSLGSDYHLDHIMPLALGGSNEDSNIQLLRGKCNLQKGAKHPIEFMRLRGFLL